MIGANFKKHIIVNRNECQISANLVKQKDVSAITGYMYCFCSQNYNIY